MSAGSSFALSVVALTGQFEHSTRAQVHRWRARTRHKSNLGNSTDGSPSIEDRRWQPHLQSSAGCVLQYDPEAVDQNVAGNRCKVAILNHQRPIRSERRLAANCPSHDQDKEDEPVAGSLHSRKIPQTCPPVSAIASLVEARWARLRAGEGLFRNAESASVVPGPASVVPETYSETQRTDPVICECGDFVGR
jgi:hypothetical protein